MSLLLYIKIYKKKKLLFYLQILINDFFDSIQFIRSRSDPEKNVSFELIEEIHNKIKTQNSKNETLQHLLSKELEFANQKKIDEYFSTPEEVAWLQSLRDSDCGLWLDIAPKTKMHTMKNAEFEMALL